MGGSKANVQSECIYIYVCVLCCSEFCRCIVSTIRRKRKRKRHERKEEESSSSDDHILVADDIVHHCLLKLDIFRSRHVLGKRIRIQ